MAHTTSQLIAIDRITSSMALPSQRRASTSGVVAARTLWQKRRRPYQIRPATIHCSSAASERATSITSGNGTSSSIPLLTPWKVGPYELKHRVVLAPLTRDRAVGNVPQPNMKTYYEQRATDGGLLISEGTIISHQAHGYPDVPGLYTDEQVDAWKPITSAVKDKGGVFFCQVWHCGRAAMEEHNGGVQPVSSSNIPATQNMGFSTKKMGFVPYTRPRPLTLAEIPGVVDEYRLAAFNAISAGFDGVEIHGANGYLIDQFLKTEANKRTDEYGGPIENRVRFALEVVDAVANQIGSEKVGLRLSPFGGFLNATDSHTYALNLYLIQELNKRNLAYIHMLEGTVAGNATVETAETLTPFRAVYNGTFMANGNYSRDGGNAAIESGHADLISFGRPFLANPDLVKRFEVNAPLNTPDPTTFYAPGDKGYIDYPFLAEA